MEKHPQQDIFSPNKKNDEVRAEASYLGIYAEGYKSMSAFTENDVLKKLGLTKIDDKELRELIKPDHLKYVTKMIGLKT